MRSFIKRLLPVPLRKAARILLWSAEDIRYRQRTGKRDFPPVYLRVKVVGDRDITRYLAAAEKTTQDILETLPQFGLKPSRVSSVLDFGCGCGRVIQPLSKAMPQARFFGTDTDAEAIGWCRKHLPGAEYNVNQPEPPLPYADGQFDLIYGVSVFTHLDERLQFLWLRELRRVARPGAILLLTVHGRDASADPTDSGFLFVNDGAWADFFPDFYQTTFHARDYIQKNWGEFFTLLDYRPGTLLSHQDVVVLRKE